MHLHFSLVLHYFWSVKWIVCVFCKAWFLYVGKIPDYRDFTFSRPSQILPIYRIFARGSRNDKFICDRGTGAQQFRGLVMSEIHRRRPQRYKFEFSYVGNDRRLWQKSGKCREKRNAPDSSDLSPFIPDDIGDICDFEFSLVGKIWDGRETVKSRTVWDFPDIWKPGLTRKENTILFVTQWKCKPYQWRSPCMILAWNISFSFRSLNLLH